jgi:opine dehydrogenase
MNLSEPKTAIVGAGNGAHAIAGHLGMQGFPTRLYNKFEEEIVHIRRQGGVTVEGVVQGFGPVELTTTDPKPVITWADVIMVITPAFVHRFLAETFGPHLRNGQIILLNPGRTGSSLEFARVLQEQGVTAQLHIAEAQSLVYACRISGPARARIIGIKERLALAAFPATSVLAALLFIVTGTSVLTAVLLSVLASLSLLTIALLLLA